MSMRSSKRRVSLAERANIEARCHAALKSRAAGHIPSLVSAVQMLLHALRESEADRDDMRKTLAMVRGVNRLYAKENEKLIGKKLAQQFARERKFA